MQSQSAGPIRRLSPAIAVLVLVGTLFLVARLPSASAAERDTLAGRYHFTELPIALPPGTPDRTVREVNPQYEHIKSWISSVGAAIALNDLDANGRPDDLCLVDTRSDTVVVTPAPTAPGRYEPFTLDPKPLPMGSAIAPMGCTPGDFNGDGLVDALVYYWGRTPVVFMHRPVTGAGLTLASFTPVELVPQQAAPDGTYHGPLWNTNAVSIADFDGDGHPDIGVFNYFPETQVLDPNGATNVSMNHSMSRAENAGGAHIMRWIGASAGDQPAVSYQEEPGAVPAGFATGWTLGSSSADLDGDLLPELYLANDFGHDHLFHNVSKPGRIRFQALAGRRGAYTPKSLVLGNDSFKGMAVDFGDLDSSGRFDIFVSNITTEWGLEESNFVWMNNAGTEDEAKAKMDRGTAPFDNKASDLGMAWTGWGWDAKMADFDNSGYPAVVQTAGFVQGEINRWNWLQEFVIGNDLLLQNPDMWPHARPGDDIAGHQSVAFWVRQADGHYVNVAEEVGLGATTPTRGVAVADTNGDGAEEFAIARQWGAPAFYRNDKAAGGYLTLRLLRPVQNAAGTTGTAGSAVAAGPVGSPAYGAVVKIRTADGRTQIAQLDGGGGHSGKRDFDVHFGLGAGAAKPVSATVCWRDNSGAMHEQTLELSAGGHTLMLTTQATEVQGS